MIYDNAIPGWSVQSFAVAASLLWKQCDQIRQIIPSRATIGSPWQLFFRRSSTNVNIQKSFN